MSGNEIVLVDDGTTELIIRFADKHELMHVSLAHLVIHAKYLFARSDDTTEPFLGDAVVPVLEYDEDDNASSHRYRLRLTATAERLP